MAEDYDTVKAKDYRRLADLLAGDACNASWIKRVIARLDGDARSLNRHAMRGLGVRYRQASKCVDDAIEALERNDFESAAVRLRDAADKREAARDWLNAAIDREQADNARGGE